MKPIHLAAPLAGALLVLAGCGSSSHTTSAASGGGAYGAAAASATTATTSAAGTSSAATSSAAVASAGAATAKPVTLVVKHSKLGSIVAVGGRRMTVYLFTADRGKHSSCTGECAKVWPPVVGHATAVGVASGKLGTTVRSDGTEQVTFNGHPLYTYAKDGDAGDAYGQNLKSFGADWYVLTPAGVKIDPS